MSYHPSRPICTIAALAAFSIAGIATPASATHDFFFEFNEFELQSYDTAKDLYKRLNREASIVCKSAGKVDASHAACKSDIVSRVVAGIDHNRVNRIHARALD